MEEGKSRSVNVGSLQDSASELEGDRQHEKIPLRKRILGVLWDSLDKTPEERRLIFKLDWYILTYVCLAYFVKYLDQTNVRTSGSPTKENPLISPGV